MDTSLSFLSKAYELQYVFSQPCFLAVDINEVKEGCTVATGEFIRTSEKKATVKGHAWRILMHQQHSRTLPVTIVGDDRAKPDYAGFSLFLVRA